MASGGVGELKVTKAFIFVLWREDIQEIILLFGNNSQSAIADDKRA